jgi:POT family proton-dependent oligopeptide transporter
MNMKKEAYLIYLSEFTARFCTWSILSQLLMHLTSIHWKTEPQQLYVIGASLSLLYMSAILGGSIRDWLFAGKQVILLGIGLIGLGSLLLLSTTALFYPGLSLALLGAGMVTPNTPLLLSSLSLANKNQDRNFTILYGVTNAGVILGSILGGIINGYFSWRGVLFLNESMIMLWLGCCIFTSWLTVLKNIDKIKLIQFIALLAIVELVASSYLKFERVSEALLIIAGIVYVGFLIFLMVKNSSIRKTLLVSTFLTILAIVFFSAEFQVASTLIAYAHNFVVLKIVHINIPAGSLLALESVFVVIGAFVIARVKLLSNITHVQTKVLIGLLLGALAFAILYGSTLMALHNSISVLWIATAFLFLGLGDVYLMPPIMAYVAENAPSGYKGRLIAGMYFSLSLSGYLSGLIGSTLLKYFESSSTSLHFYSTGFSVMIFILGVSAGLVLITRTINAAVYSAR